MSEPSSKNKTELASSIERMGEKRLEGWICIIRTVTFILFLMFGPLLPFLNFFSREFIFLSVIIGIYVVGEAVFIWAIDYYRPVMKYIFVTIDLLIITFLIFITPDAKPIEHFELVALYLPFIVAFSILYRFRMALYINALLAVFYPLLVLYQNQFDYRGVDWIEHGFYLLLFPVLAIVSAASSYYQWRRSLEYIGMSQSLNRELNNLKGELVTLRSENRTLGGELNSRIVELNKEKEESEQQRVQAEFRAWQIATIHNITSVVNSTVNLEKILEITVEKFSRILQIEQVDLIMFDQGDEFGYLRTSYRHGGGRKKGEKIQRVSAMIVEKSNPFVKIMQDLNRAIALEKTTRLPDEWLLLRKLMENQGFNALMLLPIKIKDDLIGIIQLNESRKARVFSPQEISLCETLVEQTASAIERGLLVKETLEKSRELSQVNALIEAEIAEKTISETRLAQLAKVANSILTELDLNKVFQTVTDSIVNYCGFEKCLICLIRKEEGNTIAAHSGIDEEELKQITESNRLTPERRALSINPIFRRSESYFIPKEANIWEENAKIPSEEYMKLIRQRVHWEKGDELFVPLFDSESQLLGVISLDDPQDRRTPKSKRLKPIEAFAQQVVLSIEHVRIYDALQEKLEVTQDAYEKLVQMDQMKSDFLAVVSHEFRTPLTSIKVFTDLLIDDVENDENANQFYLRWLNIIEQEYDRLWEIVNNILNAKELQEGSYKWDIGNMNLSSLVRDVARSYQDKMKSKGIKFQSKLLRNLPQYRGDHKNIKEMIENLLSNAHKFTPENGTVSLSLGFELDCFILRIKDTGEGILKEKMDVVFEIFRQGDGSATRKYGGVGIGLSIVKKVVDYHQGKIEVKSEVNIGTEVIIRLPLLEAENFPSNGSGISNGND